MLPNPMLRKLIQISEEALPPVHEPLIVGNNLYILTHQDVRKIEDTRHFSLSKVNANGDLKALNCQNVADCFPQDVKEGNILPNQIFFSFLELLRNRGSIFQTCQRYDVPQTQEVSSQPMDVAFVASENRTVASIEQHLHWNKCENNSPSFPIRYSQSTSTTDINYKPDVRDRQHLLTCGCCKTCHQCGVYEKVCNKSTNTQVLDAREQLKKKKLRFSFT